MGWIIAPQREQVLISENCKCYHIRKMVFAGMIKLRILTQRNYPRLSGWSLNPITSVFIIEEQKEVILQVRAEDNVKMVAEIGVM